MDFLKDDIGKLYRKFLTAAFGSALMTSIYGVVDMAMVGQYHGPNGAAAMAVIAPIWNIIYSLGLLCGIGGSVLYSVQRGESDDIQTANQYFTAAVSLAVAFSIFSLILLWRFEEPLLRLFGANDELLILAKRYLITVKFFAPFFVFTQTLAAFLRNDSNPSLATAAVCAGGVFNVFGDYFFVFTLDMGIMGAGLATGLGALCSCLVMSTHFFSKKCSLRFAIPKKIGDICVKIIGAGFSSFFLDIAMGILTMLFNRQIMYYFGETELAVYGVIVNISTFVQCCAYGIGQASQPIFSQNFGAKQYTRIKRLIKYNLITILILGSVWTISVIAAPNAFITVFMTPTEEVLTAAPFILRCYASSFFLLLFNVYSTYYFQSILEPLTAMIVSVSRGLVLSGSLILLAPKIFGANAIWLAMTATEIGVAVFASWKMKKFIGKPI